MNYPEATIQASYNNEVDPAILSPGRYSVQIEPLHIGFLLRVGCQNIAVATKEDLIKFLTAYYTDTQRVIKEYENSDKTYQSLLEITN